MPATAKTNSTRTPTGVAGFDAITGGGVPAGRVTVVMGGAGSGKTIFALQTLVHGAGRCKEPGLFVAFEEKSQNVLSDMAQFEWNVGDVRRKDLGFIDAQIPEPVLRDGAFDLLGLLAVIDAGARRIGAKRVVLDGIDVLLGVIGDPVLIRRELFRLREWLLESKLTAIITAKTDPAHQGLAPDYDVLQFLADCVVCFNHRLSDGTAVRTLRVAKLRGSAHSANEFPFAISSSGIEVASGASREIDHRVLSDKVETGVSRLDTMLGGGYFRGSSILISGVPGTAKTTLAAAFAEAACRRGERTLFVSFDEAPNQIVRNLESVKIHLGRHIRSGTLRLCGLRTRSTNAEAHISHIWRLIREHRPENLVIDPLSALAYLGNASLTEAAALQVIDLAKREGITVLSTTLTNDANPLAESTSISISTVADTWIQLSYVSQGGERNRALTIIKSRGMSHSNQVRELVLADAGVTLADVSLASGEVLMGTLRWQRERDELQAHERARLDTLRRKREAELALAETKARLLTLDHERALREADITRLAEETESSERQQARDHAMLQALRQVDSSTVKRRRGSAGRAARTRGR